MKLSTLSSIFALVAPLVLCAAPAVPRNPQGTIAVADFPQGGDHTFTRGYVIFSSPDGGKVNVHVDMTGLPQHDGPFYYHIHDVAVGENGDCETAGPHFDPYHGLEVCPAQGDDAQCQVGDLLGKHGWINTTCFQTSYVDPFVSLDVLSPANVVGRSVVFHYADMRRFACATIRIATDSQVDSLAAYHLDEVVEVDVGSEDDFEHTKRDTEQDHTEGDDQERDEVAMATEDRVNASWANWSNATQLAYESVSSQDVGGVLRTGAGSLLGVLLGALL